MKALSTTYLSMLFFLLFVVTGIHEPIFADRLVTEPSATPNTIHAFHYLEFRGDGKFNEQDAPLQGWELCLSGNSLQKPLCKITPEDGWLSWKTIPPGEYRLTVTANAKQKAAGYVQYEGKEGYTVIVSANGIVTYRKNGQLMQHAYFGNRLAEIHGHFFHDLNKDGKNTFSRADELLGGWLVYLDMNNNGTFENTTLTQWTGCIEGVTIAECIGEDNEPFLLSSYEDGTWHFRNLPKGTYVVRFVPQQGWKQTAPTITEGVDYFTKTVDGSSPYPWLDFGFYPDGSAPILTPTAMPQSVTDSDASLTPAVQGTTIAQEPETKKSFLQNYLNAFVTFWGKILPFEKK